MAKVLIIFQKSLRGGGRISGFQSFRVSGFQNFRVTGVQGYRVQEFKDSNKKLAINSWQFAKEKKPESEKFKSSGVQEFKGSKVLVEGFKPGFQACQNCRYIAEIEPIFVVQEGFQRYRIAGI
jgi:hypothetical protein